MFSGVSCISDPHIKDTRIFTEALDLASAMLPWLALLDFIPYDSESLLHGMQELSIRRGEEQGRDKRQVQDEDGSYGRTASGENDRCLVC